MVEIDESDYRESEDEDYKLEQQSDEEVDSDVEESTAKAIKEQKQSDQNERFVRTRSQVEKAPEEKQVEVKGSSVDVDALWAEMNTGPATKPSSNASAVNESKLSSIDSSAAPATPGTAPPAIPVVTTGIKIDSPVKNVPNAPESLKSKGLTDELITITRTYKFAGKITTETKTVKATSAEGREYLKEQAQAAQTSDATQSKPKRRVGPVKRAISLEDEFKAGKAKKLNTLAKSKLDWLGFVDKEGIQEDLKKHNKSGYLDKQAFLGRVDMNLDRQQNQPPR